MALTRADSFTETKKQQEYFSDFFDDFDKTPFGDQLARVTNERSVSRAIVRLIKTNYGDRLFQPEIGSDVMASLFELSGQLLVNKLKFLIENTLKYNETRAEIIKIDVETTETNDRVQEHGLAVTIVYNLINNPDPIVLEFILKRIR